MSNYVEVNQFWFDELTPIQWFKKDTELDQTIAARFGDLHAQAAAGELADWRDAPEGRLAEIIVLDQFSRNIYRDHAKAFACDSLALVLAQEAIRIGADKALPNEQRVFVYMPYMHSESKLIHEHAMQIFAEYGNADNLEFERKHKVIIDRFGRYPHRNAILGRVSTDEEIAFLSEPNSSF